MSAERMNREKGFTRMITELDLLRDAWKRALQSRMDSAIRLANLAVKRIEPAQEDIDRYVSLTEAEDVAWKAYYEKTQKGPAD